MHGAILKARPRTLCRLVAVDVELRGLVGEADETLELGLASVPRALEQITIAGEFAVLGLIDEVDLIGGWLIARYDREFEDLVRVAVVKQRDAIATWSSSKETISVPSISEGSSPGSAPSAGGRVSRVPMATERSPATGARRPPRGWCRSRPPRYP